MRWLGWWAMLVGFLLATMPSGCREEEDACSIDKSALLHCDRRYTEDICATEGGRCAAACYARASCEDLDRVDRGETPGWLSICLYPCRDPFACGDGTAIDSEWVCDGESDCVDGSDEDGCSYFECRSGEVVSSDSACDEWPDCGDWSDEDGCEHFVCGDLSLVSGRARCDGELDCTAGRDEEGCP